MNPKKADAPPDRTAMTPEAIRHFVEANDDFGFEMKVAAEIKRSLPVDVFHGATYTDPVTTKPRQFDLRFKIKEDRKTLYFAVECKNISPVSPIVICGRAAESKESFHDIIITRGSGRLIQASTRRAYGGIFNRGTFVGKSILKPDKNARSNDSEIYDRWAQALASAHDLVREAAYLGSSFDTCNFGAVFPWVVVPDNTLWTADYNDSGKLISDPSTVDHCSYFVGHHYAIDGMDDKVCLSHIEFLTFTGLQLSLHKLKTVSQDWDDWIPQKIRSSYLGG